MRNCSKRLLSALLAAIMVFTILPAWLMSASAAADVVKGRAVVNADTITITNRAVANITDTDAKIAADISSVQYVTVCGFYIGLARTQLNDKISEEINGNANYLYYNVASAWHDLTPGTTYYYKFFAKIGGVEYQSSVDSFRTTTPSTVVTASAATNISNTDAKISATVSPMQYVTTAGFYIGLTAASMATKISEDVNGNVVTFSYFIANEWKLLTPGTTYYYRMFVVVDGTEFKSAVMSFKTTGVTPAVTAAVANIGDTDANIAGTLSALFYVTDCGFDIGLTSATMNTRFKEDVDGNISNFGYNITTDWKALVPGTDYYFRMFAIINGTEYQSAVIHFKTTGKNPVTTVTNNAVTGVTYTGAQISVTLSQPVALVNCGIRYGTDAGNLVNVYTKNVTGSVSTVTFAFPAINALKPGTTFFYQVFVNIADEPERTGDVANFTTLAGDVKIKYRTTVLGDVYNYRVGLFKYYRNISLQLTAAAYTENYTGLKWTSDNASVIIDQNGMITNTGKGNRSAYITVELKDSFGTVYKKSVLVNFYKAFWDKK